MQVALGDDLEQGVGVFGEHTRALQNVVLASFTTDRPCATKPNRPPSAAALAIAAEIAGPAAASPVIDLAAYQAVIDREDAR